MKMISDKIKQNIDTLLRGKGLKGNVMRGGAWLGAASFFEQSLRFGRNMLMTRLLAPDAFGAMAIVLSATSLIQMTVEVGAREALIQNPKGSDESHVNAAWWMTLARASFVYSLIYVCAPAIATFYKNGELVPLARVVTLSLLFDGAMSPRAYVAMKELRFWKWAVVNNGGGILGVIVTVILGFFLRDVWALAIGFASENVARCILSFVICPFRPHLPAMSAVRDLLKFSKGVFGLALFNLIFSRADIFVLGKIYSPAQLGLYSMAVYLIQTPGVFLMNVMNQTLLPALSHVQNDDERMNRILLQVTSSTALVGFPAAAFVAYSGHSLLILAYGARYGAASAALGFACFAVLFNLLNNQLTMAFYAKGLPQLHRRAVATMAAVVVILVYPLAKTFGIWGGQLACLIAMAIGYLLQVERIRGVTGLRMSRYWKGFPVPVSTSVAVAILWIIFAKQVNVLTRPVPDILLGIAGCFVVYGLVLSLESRKTEESI